MRDETLYAQNAHTLLLPASTMKIVTLAAAADRLGWDFTYRTRVTAVGAIQGGMLGGDLLIEGSGDPSLDDWDGAASEVFARWARELQKAGIRRITGRIVGDDNAFDDEGLGEGWAWDDLGSSYATRVGGLQYNENAARVVVGPGESAGEPANVTVEPEAAQLVLRNLVATVPAGAPGSIQLRLLPLTATLELRGAVRVDQSPVTMNASVPNPTLYFANAVRLALVRNGIEVDGPAVDIDDLRDPPSRGAAPALTEAVSPPLATLASTMMKFSQNLFAESLLKTTGGSTSGTGSTDAGLTVVKATLAAWGVSANDVLMVDGSGLSRYNLITPDALASVLMHVYKDDRLRERFIEALPNAGIDGTLSERMHDTSALGNARAKTGSLSNTRALAGYVHTADREPLVFAILANNTGVEARVVDAATDAIVGALAAFSRR